MALEGQAAGDQNTETSTSADTNVGDKTTSGTQETKTTTQSGNSTGQNEDYEKRFKGIQADLQKERKARQQYEADLKTARAEVDSERKRVRALAGVETKSESETEDEAIKQRLQALGYPSLTKEDLEALRELRQTQGNLQQTTEHYWIRHAGQMVDSVYGEVEKEIGGKLSARQKERIQAEYAREAGRNPEFLERHESGDKTLAAEFAKQLSEDWFEPARRKYTQQESQRFRAVPSGKDRGIVTHGEKKVDVNNNDAVMDVLVKGFRERNGDFTGRR
mgnify:CR=1 FL=1